MGERSSKTTYAQYGAQTETQACWETGANLLFTLPSPTNLSSFIDQYPWGTWHGASVMSEAEMIPDFMELMVWEKDILIK